MIHKLTDIHPNAKIASGVRIGGFTTIEDNVEIGEGTEIGPNVTIMNGTRIGKYCKIFPGAVVGALPQDLKFEGEDTLLIVGDYTTVRECATLNRGTKASGKTEIGSNCLIMAYVHVAHDCTIGNHCILANGVQLGGHIVIGDYAIIGGLSALHQFSRIGAHVILAGGSLVRKDIPPYIKAGKEPVKYCGVNSVGLKRRGFPDEKILEIERIYKHIFLKGLNNSLAIESIEEEFIPSFERDEIVRFMKSSERGNIR